MNAGTVDRNESRIVRLEASIVTASPVFIATMNSEFGFSIARSSLGSPEWCASNSVRADEHFIAYLLGSNLAMVNGYAGVVPAPKKSNWCRSYVFEAASIIR
jgi:hypothetical protein